MLKSLYSKLTLAFMLVAFTTAALVALFIRMTSADRLMQLIIDQQRSNLEQALGEYYAGNGAWDGVADNWKQIQSQSRPTAALPPPDHPSDNSHPPDFSGDRNYFGLADGEGVVLVSVDPQYPVGSTLSQDILEGGVPVAVNGVQVGTILTASQPPEFNPQEAKFLQRTNQALLLASLVALLVALVLGVLLARTLTGPLQALTQAAQRITRGELEQQVRVRTNDEIGQLAAAFNLMSQEVARVNQLRRQMTADIAHDLRTPLTVISGYIESMRDGVLQPTPERLALIYSEIELLQNLVEDLRMLSLADAGELSLNPQELEPQNLLERAAALFRHQADQQNVTISVLAENDLPEIWVDEARMMQIFGNLINNALRFTPEGGRIILSAIQRGGSLEIAVQDTGEGIPAEEIPYLFDRFHRVDKSRHNESGETGLGLAIVKALVEAQGGSASVESIPGEGTTIKLSFPVLK